jgi:hypothetical protein
MIAATRRRLRTFRRPSAPAAARCCVPASSRALPPAREATPSARPAPRTQTDWQRQWSGQPLRMRAPLADVWKSVRRRHPANADARFRYPARAGSRRSCRLAFDLLVRHASSPVYPARLAIAKTRTARGVKSWRGLSKARWCAAIPRIRRRPDVTPFRQAKASTALGRETCLSGAPGDSARGARIGRYVGRLHPTLEYAFNA